MDRIYSSVSSWLGLLLALVAMAGCENAPSAADIKEATRVRGTWEFVSLRGGMPEDRETEQQLSGELVLSSDSSFTYESGSSGNNGWHESGQGRWEVKDGVVMLHYQERNGSPYSNVARFEILRDELILNPSDQAFVFVFAKTQP